ncbi:coadhesin-like [Mytilus trossulus]|uniref:coadhesin-like n=1 Tax=Mytilus trossulus TaxID=6551 RepID=UPI003004F103
MKDFLEWAANEPGLLYYGLCTDFNTTSELKDFETASCIISVDGGWSPWFNSSCSVSCGEGVRIRNRTCDNPPPSGSGQHCVGSETEKSICNLGKCPIDGGWSPWFNSSCSVSCGEGVRIRNRTCDNPPPSGSGQHCVGSETEKSICNLGKCPIDGGWSPWFNSSCSVSCGEGVRIRNRTCDNPPPSGSGQHCVGSETEKSICNLGKCPIDGGWSPWFNSSCSVSCGEGVRIRNRTCDNPPPSGSGQHCVGSETEKSICNLGKCPKSCRHSNKRIRQQTRRRFGQ